MQQISYQIKHFLISNALKDDFRPAEWKIEKLFNDLLHERFCIHNPRA